MGELSMEKLHFQAKSAANFVKLGCTILLKRETGWMILGRCGMSILTVTQEIGFFNGLWKKPFRMGALSEKRVDADHQ